MLRPRRISRFCLLLLLALLTSACETRRDDGWVRPLAQSSTELVDPGTGRFDTCPGQLAAPTSNLLFGLSTLSLAAMLTWSCLRTRALRHQVASKQAIDPVAPLRAGPYVLVGTVEVDDAENPVTIRIEQTGTESLHKNNWSHVWKETSRRTVVRPFVVRRDDGQAIKIEPGVRVVLHDTLSRFVSTSPTTRTRIAQLEPGDRIYATGKLVDLGVHGGGGVYREAPRMPRLIPASTGPMLLSTEAPGGTARRLARVHKWSAIAVGAALAFQLLFLTGPFWLQHLAGTTTTGTVEYIQTYQTYHKPKNGTGYWTTHQEARISWSDKLQTFRIAEDLYSCARHDGCTRVTVRHASLAGITTSQLGSHPTLGITRSIILLILTILVAIAWPAAIVASRPWWLRGRVIDHGTGRLSTTTTSITDAVPPTK